MTTFVIYIRCSDLPVTNFHRDELSNDLTLSLNKENFNKLNVRQLNPQDETIFQSNFDKNSCRVERRLQDNMKASTTIKVHVYRERDVNGSDASASKRRRSRDHLADAGPRVYACVRSQLSRVVYRGIHPGA